jgi:membrane protein implicated in regulation of membrane protease activity
VYTDDAIGLTGQVTIAIPQGGVGEVGVTVKGSYQSYSARAENNLPISAGRQIKVKSNTGGQLVVTAAS